MDLYLSDELLGALVPIIVFWLYSGFYAMFEPLENYRLHSTQDEVATNLVSRVTVIKGVLFQQVIQGVVGFIIFNVTSNEFANAGQSKGHSFIHIAIQFFIAMVVFDTWQYFMHRLMHQNKFLYRHIHSLHHRLIVPYSFGAMYNHPLEGFLFDIMGGAIAFVISGMSPRTSMFFFSFGSMKAVDDHCGMWLPGNPFHFLFSNNSAYHDVHHQLYGAKYNFSQPFFVSWDKICGTYMPYILEKRASGGYKVKPLKVDKDD